MPRSPSRSAPDAAPERLRLFVAVPPPPAVLDAAEAAAAALRGMSDVRWIARDRMHLTLKFLGAAPAAQVEPLREALERIANTFSRFVVDLAGPGAFPNRRAPRTLWLGLGPSGAERLAGLAEGVDRAAAALGFEREARPFRGHLTLGRVRSDRGLAELRERLETAAAAPEPGVEWEIDEIQLVRSVLRPSGPEYTPLGRYPLRPEE